MRMLTGDMRAGYVLFRRVQAMNEIVFLEEIEDSVYRHRQELIAKFVATVVGQFIC